MLYTTFYRQSPEKINKTSRIPQKDTLNSQYSNEMAKNVLTSFNLIFRQKHGRKFVLKEGRQSKIKSKFNCYPTHSGHRSSVSQQKSQKFKPEVTIYWQNRHKNIKRHTYNSQCFPSQEQNNAQSDIKILKTSQKQRIIFPHAANTQQTIKRKFNDKNAWKEKRVSYLKDWNGENIAEKLDSNKKINPIGINNHSKFASIDFSKEKTPLVDLIRKFEFENLKTAHLPSSSSKNSLQDKKKYSQYLMKTMADTKNGTYFKDYQEKNKKYKKQWQRKINRTISKGFKKYLQQSIQKNQNIQRKTNSVLSPWATQTQIINFNT